MKSVCTNTCVRRSAPADTGSSAHPAPPAAPAGGSARAHGGSAQPVTPLPATSCHRRRERGVKTGSKKSSHGKTCLTVEESAKRLREEPQSRNSSFQGAPLAEAASEAGSRHENPRCTEQHGETGGRERLACMSPARRTEQTLWVPDSITAENRKQGGRFGASPLLPGGRRRSRIHGCWVPAVPWPSADGRDAPSEPSSSPVLPGEAQAHASVRAGVFRGALPWHHHTRVHLAHQKTALFPFFLSFSFFFLGKWVCSC